MPHLSLEQTLKNHLSPSRKKSFAKINSNKNIAPKRQACPKRCRSCSTRSGQNPNRKSLRSPWQNSAIDTSGFVFFLRAHHYIAVFSTRETGGFHNPKYWNLWQSPYICWLGGVALVRELWFPGVVLLRPLSENMASNYQKKNHHHLQSTSTTPTVASLLTLRSRSFALKLPKHHWNLLTPKKPSQKIPPFATNPSKNLGFLDNHWGLSSRSTLPGFRSPRKRTSTNG